MSKRSERVIPVEMADEERIDFIKRNFDRMPVKQICRQVGKSRAYVMNRFRDLGLVVPDEVKAKFKENSLYKKGNVPVRTFSGLEGIATRFNKGNIPGNTLYDGAITKRADKRGVEYYFVRVSMGVWEPLHRYVWKQHHGEILAGMVIIFVNGDTMDCSIENLKMISKRENRKRNRSALWYALKMYKDIETAKAALEETPHLVELYKKNCELKRSIKNAVGRH